ncbi:hypothetical protein Godav_024814, partial [Gossypium davidsonii]|nr:hypothetical protein [Gossypium davidsonii]
DYTCISVTQNSLQELKEIWDRWNDETKQLFYSNYGDLLYLFDVKVNKAYSRVAYVPAFWNKVMNITGMNLILAHPDGKKKVDVFAFSIYGLVIFPRALGHVDEAISDIFD